MIEARIAVALANAAWQSVLVAFVAGAALRLFGRTSATVRCTVWCGALAVVAALPLLDLATAHVVASGSAAPAASAFRLSIAAQPLPAIHPAHVAPSAVHVAIADASPSARSTFLDDVRRAGALLFVRAGGILCALWLAGVALCALRLMYGLRVLAATRRTLEPLAGDWLGRLHCKRALRVAAGDRITVPCLVGLRNPTIAIPRPLVSALRSDDLRRIVLHEAAHAQRYDDWLNLFVQIVRATLFFNPVVHYIATRIAVEREIACDDRVVESMGDRVVYAECLSAIARDVTMRGVAVPAFFGRRAQIVVRIEQLLDRAHDGSSAIGRRPFVAVAALLALALATAPFGIPVIAAASAAQPVPPPPPPPRAAPAAPAAAPAPAALAVPPAPQAPRAPVPAAVAHPAAPAHPARPPHPARAPIAPRAPRVHAHADEYLHQHLYVDEHVHEQLVVAEREITLGQPAPPARPHAAPHPAPAYVAVAPAAPRVADASAVAAEAPVPPATAVRAPRAPVAVAEDDRSRDGDSPGSDFIGGMVAAGYANLTVDQLIKLRDHGVDGHFAAAMNAAARRHLSPDELCVLRDHGVDEEFSSKLAALGLTVPYDKLIALHDHGVDPGFIAAMQRAGYSLDSVDGLIQLRDHGVSADFATAMNAAEGRRVSLDDLVRLRDHGVDTEYVAALRRTGLAGVSVEQLIRLRDHGVDAAFVDHIRSYFSSRQMNVDEVIRMKDAGL
jgi:beta-lactamase regulating signal transducer with metallopeptidase domain